MDGGGPDTAKTVSSMKGHRSGRLRQQGCHPHTLLLQCVRIVLAVIALLAAAAPAASAAAKHHSKPPGPLLLHLSFHKDGSDVVLTTPQYAFLPSAPTFEAGTLIDDRTGKRTLVTPPAGCRPTHMGGLSLLFECQSGSSLVYEISTAIWKPFPAPAAYSGPNLQQQITPAAVGTHWIEYFSKFCDPTGISHACGDQTYFFQNIDTGKFRSDPTTATTLADPNLVDLTRKLCSPLRVPERDTSGGFEAGASFKIQGAPGAVTLAGSFALVQKTDFSTYNSTVYLEHCGSRLHQVVGGPHLDFSVPANNYRLILWPDGSDRLIGLLLPSRRRVVVPLSSAMIGRTQTLFGPLSNFPAQVALTERRLFVVETGATPASSAWSTTLPRLPAR